jgi:hypothetical protein
MDYTDTRYPSIRLDSPQTVLPGVPALALCNPPDGVAKPVQPGETGFFSTLPISPPNIARNAAAHLEGRGRPRGQVATQPGKMPGPTPPATAPAAPGNEVFDHPDVGGRFTICVLFWGPEQYYDLHKRCLEAIVRTVPPLRMDLRVGSNELNQRSLSLLKDHLDRGLITKHYRHDTNACKYPVMREMFYDPSCPITTKWVVWFDDDSIAERTPDWLKFAAQSIIQHHRQDNVHMLGKKFVWKLERGQREWYEHRPWHRGQPWRASNGKPAPNGDRIIFATGGWWVITHEAIVKCDIPDRELGHNGGDICIGEQLYQGGYNLKMFNTNKQIVHTSSVQRRGITQPHPGMPGFAPRR